MTSYSHVRNSVEEIPFEINKNLPKRPLALYEQIPSDDLKQLIAMHPHSSLGELCELVHKEKGVKLSTNAMCRLVKRYDIRRLHRSQAAALALAA
jgi:hypothetical protein